MYSPLLVDAFSSKTTQLKLPNMSPVVQEAEKTTHESSTFECFKWKKWCHSQKSTMTNEKILKKLKRLPKKISMLQQQECFCMQYLTRSMYILYSIEFSGNFGASSLHLPLIGIGDSSRVKHEHVIFNAVAFSKSPDRK